MRHYSEGVSMRKFSAKNDLRAFHRTKVIVNLTSLVKRAHESKTPLVWAALMLWAQALIGPAAYASSPSGNRLFGECEAWERVSQGKGTTEQDVLRGGVCIGFVLGVTTSLASAEKPLVCIPANVEDGQLYAMVLKFLRDNPEKRHLPARITVAMTLAQAGFLCQPTN